MVNPGKPEHPVIPHHRPPLAQRQIIAQVVVSAVILVSGIAIGGGGTILALKNRIVPVIRTQTPSGTTAGRDPNEAAKQSDWIVDRWKADYGLDNKQAQRAKKTLINEFAATQKLWEEFGKAEQDQREKLVLAMKGILTAEQHLKWESDFRRMVKHLQSMRPFDLRRGGRGGPPGERGDWPPDRRMDPNDRRGDWRRDRFRGPDGRPNNGRSKGFMGPEGGPPPGQLMGDPNGPRGDRPPEGFRGFDRGRPPELTDPNGPRGDRPPEGFIDHEREKPPEPPSDPNAPRDKTRGE
jgi:hypothetical protein